ATAPGPPVTVAFSSSGADQRGALNLNADGSTLYVEYACYGASNPGWMTTVATGMSNGLSNGQTPAVVSAYSAIDTTQLVANGGKQGNGYLINGTSHLNNPVPRPGSPASFPADLTRRPPGTVTPSQDPSLYDTDPVTGARPYYSGNQVGPLSLFGPYNESSASGNTAKARDTPSTAFGPDGTAYVV